MTQQPGTFPKKVSATLELRSGQIVVVAEDGTVDSLRVAAGGTIEFEAPANSPIKWWSILWKTDTPFDDATGWASDARGRKKPKKISADANGGGSGQRAYDYAVVASDGTRVYFRDPEVVVGPTGPP